jgi:hypothetical protein
LSVNFFKKSVKMDMPRTRTIYNALALYADQVGAQLTQTGLGDVLQLSRVQTFDEDFSRNFTDINQFGNLASVDRIEVETPTVSASFSYYLTNGFNDHALGLAVPPLNFPSGNIITAIGGLLAKQTDEKNYYLLIADEGNDSIGYRGNSGVIAVGNGYITSYSINAAVGDIPTADVEIEGLNVAVYQQSNFSASGAPLPSINPILGRKSDGFFRLPAAVAGSGIPSALIPGDITFSIPTSGVMGFEETDLKVQDFTLSFDLGRTPVQKIGNAFAISREIDFPVTATLELNAEVGDLRNGNLGELLCDPNSQNFTIQMRQPGCGTDKATALSFIFRGAKLNSQSFTSAIGDNASMSASYEVQLGGISDRDKGVFISGSYYDVCVSATGNRPHFTTTGTSYGITYPGGRYFTNQTSSQSFGGATFPGLSTGTFIDGGGSRQEITLTNSVGVGRAASWNGFTNLITGWSPNTGWLEFSPGSFIAITRTGNSTSNTPINWYSTSRNPNTLSASEKSFDSPAFNTFTLLHTTGAGVTYTVTGGLAALPTTSNPQETVIGYLPPNDRFLFLGCSSGPSTAPAFVSVSGSTAGRYGVTPSFEGACQNPSNFNISYNTGAPTYFLQV